MTAKILLVEDDENKRTRVLEALSASPGSTTTCAQSYHSALERLLSDSFDIILLDMSLPTFDVTKYDDGGQPQPFAGRELLRQMRRRGISGKVLVVTQFDRFGEGDKSVTLEALDEDLRAQFGSMYLGSIHYEEVTGAWQEELRRKLADALGEGA